MTDWERLAKELIYSMERSNIREYAAFLCDTRRYLWSNFVAGLLRGLGSAIGFSVLGAIALMIISRMFGITFE